MSDGIEGHKKASPSSVARCGNCKWCRGHVADWDYLKKCLHPENKTEAGYPSSTRSSKVCPKWSWDFLGLRKQPREDSLAVRFIARRIEANHMPASPFDSGYESNPDDGMWLATLIAKIEDDTKEDDQ